MTIERWDDQKLDKLAESIADLRTLFAETKVTQDQLIQSNARALEAFSNETRPYLNALIAGQIRMQEMLEKHEVAIAKHDQRMEEIAQNHQAEMTLIGERQMESDRRFYILLEEIRHARGS
jgi:predicted nuclease with TOPRIM domain